MCYFFWTLETFHPGTYYILNKRVKCEIKHASSCEAFYDKRRERRKKRNQDDIMGDLHAMI
jgi:tmRNA-binding protein